MLYRESIKKENGGLKHLCDQMYPHIVDYYEINVYDDGYPYVDDENKDTAYDEFRDWYEDDYDHLQGTHICIGDWLAGKASSPQLTHSESAFARAHPCVSSSVGFGNNPSAPPQIAVHECLHTIINRSLGDIPEWIDNEDDEHYLGQVFEITSSKGGGSPLLGSYDPNEQGANGSCSNDEGMEKEELWTELTDCEHDAVQVTADNDFDS